MPVSHKRKTSKKSSKSSKRSKNVKRNKKTGSVIKKMRGGAGEVILIFPDGNTKPILPHYMDALNTFLLEENKNNNVSKIYIYKYNKNGYNIDIQRDFDNTNIDYQSRRYICTTVDGAKRIIYDKSYDIDEFCSLIKDMDIDIINPRNLQNLERFKTLEIKCRKYFTYATGFKVDLSNIIKQHINEKDSDGKTALHYAIERYIANKEDYVYTFILACANIDVNIQDNDGKTVLHTYLTGINDEKDLSNKLELLKVFLDKNGTMTIKDNQGISPANLLFPL